MSSGTEWELFESYYNVGQKALIFSNNLAFFLLDFMFI